MTIRSLSSAVILLVFLVSTAGASDAFPDTEQWIDRGDPAKQMVDGLHRYLDRMTADSIASRARHWHRDLSSPEAYDRSVEPQRNVLRKLLGCESVLASPVRIEVEFASGQSPELAKGRSWVARQVRWRVYDDVEARGIWIEPTSPVRACAVALPDCDITAEQFIGLTPGLSETAQIPRLLAEQGVRVLIPTLLSRSDRLSGNPAIRMTNLSHREWVYRQAYEVGRHPIGYEVDMVRAGVAWLASEQQGKLPVGIVGQGEGGSIALHAAALEPKIKAGWVGGYFSPREKVWQEPIDRNVWGFLQQLGGAELASLVAPRSLLIEACRGPEVTGPRPARNGRSDAASGRLTTPTPEDVQREFDRLSAMVGGIAGLKGKPTLISSSGGEPNEKGTTLGLFLEQLGLQPIRVEGASAPIVLGELRPEEREAAMLRAWVAHTQQLVRTSELRRMAYWSKVDMSSAAAWEKSVEPYRQRFWDDLIGNLPVSRGPERVRSAKLYNEPKWTGYAIEIGMETDLVASGVLLWPKDMKPGERRPVVVCQHGLEGTPDPIVDRKIKSVYNSFGAQLADLGYIVYAPQNPYIGHDHFRQLQRKANPLKQSLFSIIVRQHERTLAWLETLPNVDPKRIAFYGLSYGGKTAMRVPAILKNYCLSICSADFNEWVVKTTNLDRQYSYLFTVEYDMYEFGLAEMANYAEMAALISPQPFMVERGHRDGVAPDEWIGYEFAKVRRHYDELGIGDRAEIGYFNAGHQIDGKATFAFLAKHLNWPAGQPSP